MKVVRPLLCKEIEIPLVRSLLNALLTCTYIINISTGEGRVALPSDINRPQRNGTVPPSGSVFLHHHIIIDYQNEMAERPGAATNGIPLQSQVEWKL